MESIPTIGPKELAALPWLPKGDVVAPPVPFSDDTLSSLAKTHVLVFTPALPITINWLRDRFGTDPAREPCMYNQDWYLKEDFAAKTELDGQWHLLRKEVLHDARAKEPGEIEVSVRGEQFASAVTYAFAFFAWWFLHGEALWKHDFLWCSDRDHNGDRIYVGRYEDPEGVNKNGFNIHRHLSLRSAHSAAPEVVG
jgi:hypothetical protein